MIKAAFFDLDGTLLSHRTCQIPAGTRLSLRQLRERGIKVYLSTGRHAIELDALPVEGLRFDGYITLNGQLCLDEERRLLCGTPFPEETARTLIAAFREKKLPLVLVEESGLTLNFVTDDVREAQAAINTPIPKISAYDGQPIYQATTFAPRDQDERIRSFLPPDCRASHSAEEGRCSS